MFFFYQNCEYICPNLITNLRISVDNLRNYLEVCTPLVWSSSAVHRVYPSYTPGHLVSGGGGRGGGAWSLSGFLNDHCDVYTSLYFSGFKHINGAIRTMSKTNSSGYLVHDVFVYVFCD